MIDLINLFFTAMALVVAYHTLSEDNKRKLHSTLNMYCEWLDKERSFPLFGGRVKVSTSIVDCAEITCISIMSGLSLFFLCISAYLIYYTFANCYSVHDIPFSSLVCLLIGLGLIYCAKNAYKS